jgi:hypothetical protein
MAAQIVFDPHDRSFVEEGVPFDLAYRKNKRPFHRRR